MLFVININSLTFNLIIKLLSRNARNKQEFSK